MYDEMLNRLHMCHLGIEKTKTRARDVIFWPTMSRDIKNKIESCDICLTYSKNNVREPLIQHDHPNGPWKKLGIDIFNYKNNNYILAVDYFSKFVEIGKIKSTNCKAVSQFIKNICSRHGIPLIIHSDNGPPFNSYDFKKFAKEYNFKHTTSSPYHPKSNGQAERTIGTITNIIKKAELAGNDINLCLLEYVNTPIAYNLPSPAQILYSRRLRSIIATNQSLLKPNVVSTNKIRETLVKNQEKVKKQYDRGSKSLENLKNGDIVKVKNMNGSNWLNGVVVSKVEIYPRSYKIRLQDNNKIIRRNRIHLIKCKKVVNKRYDCEINNYELPKVDNRHDCEINHYELPNSSENIVSKERENKIHNPKENNNSASVTLNQKDNCKEINNRNVNVGSFKSSASCSNTNTSIQYSKYRRQIKPNRKYQDTVKYINKIV